ncbi:MAG: MATE family efflux transporter [Rhodospirillaceae bacterium]|nr:MATE family efflux transporter [Rhodospirillaceae bacterium]
MLNIDRTKRIAMMALPIVGAMVSQNVLNLIDTAMVGVLGPAALAGVGVGSFANFMAIATIIGLASGVQAMASRRKGEGKVNEMAVPLNGGLFLALIIGLPLSIVLYFSAPALFPIINSDPAVVANGTPYLQARLIGALAVGFNFSYRGYWNGVGLSALYMKTLLVIHGLNILFNYLLIFGNFGFPEMGAEGAGLASTIALYIGSIIHTVMAYRLARGHGFLTRIPRSETMTTMLKLALPGSIQQFLFAAGFTVFFWIIGQVGVNEVAVSNVMINIIMVAILPGMGLGLAALSMVSEALGRGDPVDAKMWGWDAAKLGGIVLGFMGLIALFLPETILGGFIHEASVVQLGILPMRILGASMVFEGVGLVLLNTLLGAGAASRVMIISIVTQWMVGLPLAWLVGPYLGMGLVWIWVANISYRILQDIIFVIVWQRGRWAKIKI